MQLAEHPIPHTRTTHAAVHAGFPLQLQRQLITQLIEHAGAHFLKQSQSNPLM